MKTTNATKAPMYDVVREVKVKKPLTLGKVLFRSFFWLLLIILEAYLWIFKNEVMVSWATQLKDTWIDIAIVGATLLTLYFYAYAKKYVVPIKDCLNKLTFSKIVTFLVILARIGEVIMIRHNLSEFISIYHEGHLTFLVFVWVIGTAVMGFVTVNFLHNHSKRQKRKRKGQKVSTRPIIIDNRDVS
ncbi:MAG: hypothetical protein HFJ17_05750 [Clostridia bacterium]|nr:hypothetical protein [Clostridia bacterium]